MILALLLIWAGLIVTILVAVNRYRDSVEQGDGSEVVIARIQRNGLIRFKKEKAA